MQVSAPPVGDASLMRLRPLFEELGDLKRIRSAGRNGSVAARLFRRSWAALAAGAAPGRLCLEVTAAALVAARLGDLDASVMRAGGLDAAETATVLLRSFDAAAAPVAEPLRAQLRDSIDPRAAPDASAVPAFVGALERQPRAGVTCPGKRRIILEPAENHAEHCLVVAVYGVVLSPSYGADPETVFLAALAHHLHNAIVPDSGFTGEMLLREHLDTVFERATAQVVDELPEGLRDAVREAREVLPDAATAEGRAFHAADVIDRVLETAQHLERASLTMRHVLDDMHLVHEGPVKSFHDRVLHEIGLL